MGRVPNESLSYENQPSSRYPIEKGQGQVTVGGNSQQRQPPRKEIVERIQHESSQPLQRQQPCELI